MVKTDCEWIQRCNRFHYLGLIIFVEREKKTLILIYIIHYLQLRSIYIYIYTSLGELTTIHVTYIKKGKTVHYI